MRLQTKHVQTLVNDVSELQSGGCNTLMKAANNWVRAVKYGYDQDTTAYLRGKLEKELNDFRDEIGAIYDFMGDRGLRSNGSE